MATFNLQSSEVPQVILLAEQLFPGLDLSVVSKMISGISAEGTINLTKTLSPTETIDVSITITK